MDLNLVYLNVTSMLLYIIIKICKYILIDNDKKIIIKFNYKNRINLKYYEKGNIGASSFILYWKVKR